MAVRAVLCVAGLALLGGCSADDMVRRITPPEADTRAREYLALFTRRQVDSAMARLHPQLATADARVQLGKIEAVLGGQQLDSMAIVGVQVNAINGTRHANISYQMHSPGGYFLGNVATVDSIGTWFVEGVSARTLERSLEEQTRFTLAGKSPIHYFWLVLTAVCGIVSLGTMGFIASRRGMPRRWRWALASIIGVSPVDLNWATGLTGVRPFSLQLGAAAFMHAGRYAPWIITFALPLGAIVALDRYRRWRLTETSQSDTPRATPGEEPS